MRGTWHPVLACVAKTVDIELSGCIELSEQFSDMAWCRWQEEELLERWAVAEAEQTEWDAAAAKKEAEQAAWDDAARKAAEQAVWEAAAKKQVSEFIAREAPARSFASSQIQPH